MVSTLLQNMTRARRNFRQMSVSEYRRYFSDQSETPSHSSHNKNSAKVVPLSVVPLLDDDKLIGNEECCVCLNLTQCRTSCKHPLCTLCYNRLQQSHRVRCPLCRGPLSFAEPPSDLRLSKLVARVRNSGFLDLRSIGSRAVKSKDVKENDDALAALQDATTSRVLELLPGLTLRGLGRNVNALQELCALGLIKAESQDETSVRNRSVALALERVLLDCFNTHLYSPTHGGEHSLSLQALRPLVRIFIPLRDSRLVHEEVGVKWFTQQVVSALENNRMDKTFPGAVKIAYEFISLSVADRSVIDKLVLRRWEDFLRKETRPTKEASLLCSQIFDSMGVRIP